MTLKRAQLTAHEEFALEDLAQDVVVWSDVDEQIVDIDVGRVSNPPRVESRVPRPRPERRSFWVRHGSRDARPVVRPSALHRKPSELDRVDVVRVVSVVSVVSVPDLLQEFGETHGGELIAHLGREHVVKRPHARLGPETEGLGVPFPRPRFTRDDVDTFVGKCFAHDGLVALGETRASRDRIRAFAVDFGKVRHGVWNLVQKFKPRLRRTSEPSHGVQQRHVKPRDVLGKLLVTTTATPLAATPLAATPTAATPTAATPTAATPTTAT